MKYVMKLSFRGKLLLLFGLLSLLPLVAVTILVSNTIQNSYTAILLNSFNQNMEINNKLIDNFFQSNKSWIKSIAAQDFLITEMENYYENKENNEVEKQHIDTDKVFSSLVSLRRENSYLEELYITNLDGEVIVSSTTDNTGKLIIDPEFISTINTQRSPYYGWITENENETRILRLTTPLLRKKDGKIIATLAADFNIAIIKSLFNSEIQESNNTYIIDADGNPITSLPMKVTNPLQNTLPYQQCQTNNPEDTHTWVDYANRTVVGVYTCSQIDNLSFVLVTAQDQNEAFSVVRNLTWTIGIITIVISIFLIIGILSVANSITEPIKQLQKGTQEFGKGKLNVSLNIHTGDELEDLGLSFNDMAHQVSKLITNLQNRDTEIEKEKENILEERNKLKVILSGITDCVIAVDLRNNVILFNNAAEKLTGLKENDILDKQISHVLSIIDADKNLSPDEYCLKNIQNNSKQKTWEKLKLKVSDKEIPINLVSGVITDSNEISVGTILTIHDLSGESQLENMKLDFVSMAAHELRTPITSIRGYTSILSEEIEGSTVPEKHEWINNLARVSLSAEQLLALVENLLNVTKIERGVLSLNCREENWARCITDVVEALKDNAKSKNITIKINPPIDPSLTAYVDKMRIGEVTTNLLTNAINYTPFNGHIIISTRLSEDKQYIETSVKDDGPGIPKAAQNHLFEKFFRVSGPLEQGSKGNGLGLFISKSIVGMHNGKIWLVSDKGKGAEFIFSVPIASGVDYSPTS